MDKEMTFSSPRPLKESDAIMEFSCGNDLVDTWLHIRALRAIKANTARVYVTTTGDMLAGYYSLSAHSIARESVAGGWLRRNVPEQIPAILIGMLGVDLRFQGYGLGKDLLNDAVLRCLDISRTIGARAAVIDPISQRISEFYQRIGFRVIPGTSRMYFPLHHTTD